MESFYHQTENTNGSEFSTYEYPEFKADCTVPHFHKNFELLLVKEGQCSFNVGGEIFEIRKGEAIFVLPFQVHHFTASGDAQFRSVTFNELLILTLARCITNKKLVNPVFRPSKATFTTFLDTISDLFGSLSSNNIELPTAKRMKVKGCLYLIGGEILEQTIPVNMGSSDVVILDIVEYIADNFRSDLTLQSVAKDKGYNYQYLSRCFNRTLGISFKTMLNQYRTNYALSLLRDTGLSLSEVAFESGFQSVRSFDHVFKSTFGVPPKDFRKK